MLLWVTYKPYLRILSMLPSSSAQSSQLAVLITMMAPSHMNNPIPPNLCSQLQICRSGDSQYLQPSSQRQSIPEPFCFSHTHPTPMLPFPLSHHPKPLVPEPSDTTHPMHPHNQHGPPLMLGHQPRYPAVSPPTLHMFHRDVVPNVEPREEASTTYGHL